MNKFLRLALPLLNIKECATKIIKTSCIMADNFKEACLPLMKALYKGQVTVDFRVRNCTDITSVKQMMSYQCKHTGAEAKDGLRKILPEIVGAQQPIIYHVCEGTNLLAAKRQCTAVPTPSPIELNKFSIWFNKIFNNEIVPLLDIADISMSSWFSHLTSSKQTAYKPFIDRVYYLDETDFGNTILIKNRDEPLTTDYEMFVKSEKQLYSDGKAPKSRCICSPNTFHKVIMGPVTWGLEQVFKHFNGYCGGCNWQHLADEYARWEREDLTQTLQLDGSGFDRTQHQQIKDIVDQRIYKHMAQYVCHTSPELFLKFALADERKVKVTHREKDQFNKQVIVNDGYFKQIGAVFSGSCDTT